MRGGDGSIRLSTRRSDIVPWEASPAVSGDKYRVAARSVVMLFAQGAGA